MEASSARRGLSPPVYGRTSAYSRARVSRRTRPRRTQTAASAPVTNSNEPPTSSKNTWRSSDMAAEYTYVALALPFIDLEIDRTENMKPCASVSPVPSAMKVRAHAAPAERGAEAERQPLTTGATGFLSNWIGYHVRLCSDFTRTVKRRRANGTFQD